MKTFAYAPGSHKDGGKQDDVLLAKKSGTFVLLDAIWEQVNLYYIYNMCL